MGTENNPLAQFLDVPGAKTTLPVSAAKAGFSTLSLSTKPGNISTTSTIKWAATTPSTTTCALSEFSAHRRRRPSGVP
jgi:hypothetical protein